MPTTRSRTSHALNNAQVVLVDGVAHEVGMLVNTQRGQQRLRELQAAGRRPLCPCAPGAALYVTQRCGRYCLAKMPGSGPLHARSCGHYVAATWADGLDAYAGSAVSRATTGRSRLKLCRDAGRDAHADAVSLDGLFDFILSEAGLNYRDPQTRRSWSLVRGQLLSAAALFELDNGDALGDLFFIPSLLARDDYPAQVAHCLDWMRAGGTYHFVVAPVSRVMPSPFGYGVRLKYLPSLTIWIKRAVMDQWLSRWCEGIDTHLLGGQPLLALVEVRASGKSHEAYAAGISFRFVASDYQPVAHPALVEECIQLGTAGPVVSPLRFDAPLSHPMADLILTDRSRTYPWWSAMAFGDERIDRPRRHAMRLYSGAGETSGV